MRLHRRGGCLHREGFETQLGAPRWGTVFPVQAENLRQPKRKSVFYSAGRSIDTKAGRSLPSEKNGASRSGLSATAKCDFVGRQGGGRLGGFCLESGLEQGDDIGLRSAMADLSAGRNGGAASPK